MSRFLSNGIRFCCWLSLIFNIYLRIRKFLSIPDFKESLVDVIKSDVRVNWNFTFLESTFKFHEEVISNNWVTEVYFWLSDKNWCHSQNHVFLNSWETLTCNTLYYLRTSGGRGDLLVVCEYYYSGFIFQIIMLNRWMVKIMWRMVSHRIRMINVWSNE